MASVGDLLEEFILHEIIKAFAPIVHVARIRPVEVLTEEYVTGILGILGLANFLMEEEQGLVRLEGKGTPFVFGLWIVRKDVYAENRKWVTNLEIELKRNFQKFTENMHDILDSWELEFPSGLPKHKREFYFSCLEYELGASQIKALNEFFSLLYKHKYIKALPPLLDLLDRDL